MSPEYIRSLLAERDAYNQSVLSTIKSVVQDHQMLDAETLAEALRTDCAEVIYYAHASKLLEVCAWYADYTAAHLALLAAASIQKECGTDKPITDPCHIINRILDCGLGLLACAIERENPKTPEEWYSIAADLLEARPGLIFDDGTDSIDFDLR